MLIIIDVLARSFEPLTAQIYLVLAEKGEQTVPQIATITNLSRTTIYESLTFLLSKDYILYRKEGRSAYYSANHPSKLLSLIEEKKNETNIFGEELKEVVKILTGSFNLNNNKPGVRFYEGLENFWEIYDQTLTSKDTIYTIANEDAVKIFHGSMLEYDKKRVNKKIKQLIIVPDTPQSLVLQEKTKDDPFTEVKVVKDDSLSFLSTVDLFDNKFLLTTYRNQDPIMVLIEDQDIYLSQRKMFEMIWNSLK